MHFVFYALWVAAAVAAAVALCRRFMLCTVRAYEYVAVIATPDLGHDR